MGTSPPEKKPHVVVQKEYFQPENHQSLTQDSYPEDQQGSFSEKGDVIDRQVCSYQEEDKQRYYVELGEVGKYQRTCTATICFLYLLLGIMLGRLEICRDHWIV